MFLFAFLTKKKERKFREALQLAEPRQDGSAHIREIRA
jgi:hypothetical protein